MNYVKAFMIPKIYSWKPGITQKMTYQQ